MKFWDWCEVEQVRRAEWRKTAPQLTLEEAIEVVRNATTREALLSGGVYLALLPPEGIEDMSVDPRPKFLDKRNGLVRQVPLGLAFPLHEAIRGS